MNDIIPARVKFVVTQKKHYCHTCKQTILPKSSALNVSGAIGRYFNEYYCSSCDLQRIMRIPDLRLREIIRKARFTRKLEG